MDVDVLILTALVEEWKALLSTTTHPRSLPAIEWQEFPDLSSDPARPSMRLGTLRVGESQDLIVLAAHAPKMAGIAMSSTASRLIERIDPSCVALVGVCAGSRPATVLGDVVVAERVLQYSEGATTIQGHVPDITTFQPPDAWLQVARQLVPSREMWLHFSEPDEQASKRWVLDHLLDGIEPRDELDFDRYFQTQNDWRNMVNALVADNILLAENGVLRFREGQEGSARTDRYLRPPLGQESLPFAIRVGPMASGDAVVKDDGHTIDDIRSKGVRTLAALEMEAAAIGSVARDTNRDFLVVKGVMDYADGSKTDGYKRFAANAAAEVLHHLLTEPVVYERIAARRGARGPQATGTHEPKSRLPQYSDSVSPMASLGPTDHFALQEQDQAVAIVKSDGGGLAFDTGLRVDNGAPLTVWAIHCQRQQLWQLRQAHGGYLAIESVANGLVLGTVPDPSAGSPVTMQEWVNKPWQLWQPWSVTHTGACALVSAVEVPGGQMLAVDVPAEAGNHWTLTLGWLSPDSPTQKLIMVRPLR